MAKLSIEGTVEGKLIMESYVHRMDTKEAATKAIIAMHGTQINGYTCKCSWGKETDPASSSQNRSAPQQNSAQNSAYPPAPASYIPACFI